MKKSGNTYKYRIEGRDLDFSRRPTIMAISDYILQAAGEDADKYGFGVRELNCNNCSWVLSRMAVEMDRMPEQYQTINIYTWVSDISRMMTTRNFIITDEQGRRLGAATTLWAMIDLTSRHPMDLRNHPDYITALVEEPMPIPPVSKIAAAVATQQTTHRVVYSDIDFNQHANSLKYVEWMMDMLPIELHQQSVLRRYDIHFMHEARYGEVLQIGCQMGSPAIFEIKNSEGVSICRAIIDLRQ